MAEEKEWTEANRVVHEAVAKGLQASGVSISAAVFPNVAGAIVGFLFDDADLRGKIRELCDEKDKVAPATKGSKKNDKATNASETAGQDSGQGSVLGSEG